MKQGRCIFCGGMLDLPQHGQPGRADACPHCRRDLHCCRQCRFYDPSAHHECREPRAEFVRDKEAGNFCGEFEFQGGGGGVSETHTAAEVTKQKLDALFGGKKS